VGDKYNRYSTNVFHPSSRIRKIKGRVAWDFQCKIIGFLARYEEVLSFMWGINTTDIPPMYSTHPPGFRRLKGE